MLCGRISRRLVLQHKPGVLALYLGQIGPLWQPDTHLEPNHTSWRSQCTERGVDGATCVAIKLDVTVNVLAVPCLLDFAVFARRL